MNAAGDSIPCGIEIGGSPLGGNLGRDLPGRHAAVSAVGGQALRGAPCGVEHRRSARAVSARQPAAVVDAAAPDQGRAHAEAAGAALRSQRDVPADLHRRPAVPGGSRRPTWNGYSVGHWEGDTLVVETRGFRDDLWIDTWGSPMSDAGEDDREVPPAELRHARDRADDRRSEGLHEAVHRQPDADTSRPTRSWSTSSASRARKTTSGCSVRAESKRSKAQPIAGRVLHASRRTRSRAARWCEPAWRPRSSTRRSSAGIPRRSSGS